ncbi:hypothetical protein HID58_002403, partial [Brassica napus]
MLISYLLHCLQNILMFLIRLYYDDAACVLRKMCLDAKAPHLLSTLPSTLPWKFNKHVQCNKGLTRQGNGNSEELRCVIAVIRHGDQTLKQKVKLNVTEEKLLNLMLKYNGGKPRAEVREVREAPAFLSSIFYHPVARPIRCNKNVSSLYKVVRVIVIQKTLNMLRSFAKLKQLLKRFF